MRRILAVSVLTAAVLIVPARAQQADFTGV
jgi:hypothetical protein